MHRTSFKIVSHEFRQRRRSQKPMTVYAVYIEPRSVHNNLRRIVGIRRTHTRPKRNDLSLAEPETKRQMERYGVDATRYGEGWRIGLAHLGSTAPPG